MLKELFKVVRAVHYTVKHDQWAKDNVPMDERDDFDWAVCEYHGVQVQGTVAGRAMVNLDQAKSASEAQGIRDNAYEKARQISNPDLRVSTMGVIKREYEKKIGSFPEPYQR